MKTNKNTLFAVLIILLVNSVAVAQDSTAAQPFFDEGLSIRGGFGRIAVRDEFISDERYSGAIPFVGIMWSRFHDTYGYRLDLEFQHTSNLKNYNVSAGITQFRLGLDYLYPVGSFRLMSRRVMVFLGPTAEMFIHYRQQNIASGGTIDAYSFAGLFSAGIRSEAWMPISKSFCLHAVGQTSVLSLGVRMVDPSTTSESFLKILTPFAGFNAHAGVGVSYRLTGSLVVDAGYRFDITRISTWDFFISGNDNLIASVSYGF